MTDGAPNPWMMIRDDIAQLRSDMNLRLDRLVSVEVHNADLRRLDGRLNEIAGDMGVERAARAEADRDGMARIEALATALRAESAARAASVDAERAERQSEIDAASARIVRALYVLASLVLTAAGVAAGFLAAWH